MYKLNRVGKQLTKLTPTSLTDRGLLERFDLEEWIATSPDVLGEDLLVLAKEYVLPSNLRIDILALDKSANVVVVELKRDLSGGDIEWQGIKYASYCSSLIPDEIYEILAASKGIDADAARLQIEQFIDEELDQLNPEVIIPLPEARDYVTRREAKQQTRRKPAWSSFSLEKGQFSPEDLEERLLSTLQRDSDLTPRFAAFLEVLLSADRSFGREELKKVLFERGIGEDVGQTGRFMSNLSQFLTKQSNPHLRQLIAFEGGSRQGQVKDQYRIVPECRSVVASALKRWHDLTGDHLEAG
jgi:Endonuclease NucS